MVRSYLRHIASFSPAAKLFLLGELFAGMGHGVFFVLRNLYLKQTGLDEAFIGQALSVTAMGTMAVTVPLAFFMDRGSLRGYLMGGALASVAGLAGTALSPTPVLLLASSFVAGAGTSLLTVGAAPFYMRHSTPAERPFLFGVGTALGPAAALLGSGLVWLMARVWGESAADQRHMLLVGAGLAALAIPTFAMLREGEGGGASRDRQDFDRVTTMKLCAPAFVIGLGAGLTIPFINLYFRDRFDHSAGTISLIFAGAQVTTFFAFLTAPVLGRRFGAVRTVVGCQFASLPFFLVMAFTGAPALAVAGFLARHALMNMAGPVASNFAMESVPARQRALTNGLREVSWNTSWMLATALGGWMIQHPLFGRDGYTSSMLATITLYVAGSALFWAFWRRSRVLARQMPTGVPGEDSSGV
jgi:MFS family permease